MLIAGAVAARPALLVLDEPCQGLDLIARRRVLTLVNSVCRAADVSLVYITHYYEEVLPCVTHVMHIRKGVVAFSGERESYEASGLMGTAHTPAAPSPGGFTGRGAVPKAAVRAVHGATDRYGVPR